MEYKQFKKRMDSRQFRFEPRFPEKLMDLWSKPTGYRGGATTGYGSTVGKYFQKSTFTTILPQRQLVADVSSKTRAEYVRLAR